MRALRSTHPDAKCRGEVPTGERTAWCAPVSGRCSLLAACSIMVVCTAPAGGEKKTLTSYLDLECAGTSIDSALRQLVNPLATDGTKEQLRVLAENTRRFALCGTPMLDAVPVCACLSPCVHVHISDLRRSRASGRLIESRAVSAAVVEFNVPCTDGRAGANRYVD